MQFGDVIGQDHIKQKLIEEVNEGRIPHALLLCGNEGVGKTSIGDSLRTIYLLH